MNTAVAFTGLGGKTGVIGRVGTDHHGQFLLKKLKEDGIDIRRLRADGNPTFTNDIMVASDKRDIVPTTNYFGIEALEDRDREYLLQSRAILIGLRNSLFTECAEFATRERILLYVSAHRYTEEKAKPHEFYLKQYRIEAIIGDDDEVGAVARHCRFDSAMPFVITRGKEGSVFSCLRRDAVVAASAYRVVSVDPTGAGDAFAAGYIFADMIGMGQADCLALGNACGAIAVTGYGAQQLFSREVVEKLIKEQNSSE
jgi:ribokinase